MTPTTNWYYFFNTLSGCISALNTLHGTTKIFTHNWPEQEWTKAHLILCIPRSESCDDCVHLTHKIYYNQFRIHQHSEHTHVRVVRIAKCLELCFIGFEFWSFRLTARETMISADQSMLINLWDCNLNSCVSVCVCVRAERHKLSQEMKSVWSC